MKRQPSEWKKTHENHICDKGFISRICKEFLKLNNKMTTQSKKWANDLNRYFSKEDIQKDNKHRERCSTALAIMEMQNKTIVRYYFIPTRMARIKKNRQQMLENCNPHTLLVETYNDTATLETSLAVP